MLLVPAIKNPPLGRSGWNGTTTLYVMSMTESTLPAVPQYTWMSAARTAPPSVASIVRQLLPMLPKELGQKMVLTPGSAPALVAMLPTPVPAFGLAVDSLAPWNHRGPHSMQSCPAGGVMAPSTQPRPSELVIW